MKKTPLRTILFGRSILIAGLESSLRNQLDIKVLKRMEEITELEQISSHNVDLVLFDNTLPEAKMIPTLLGVNPNLIVVGMDLSSHQIIFYSGKEYTVNNFSDIANFIYEQSNDEKQNKIS